MTPLLLAGYVGAFIGFLFGWLAALALVNRVRRGRRLPYGVLLRVESSYGVDELPAPSEAVRLN